MSSSLGVSISNKAWEVHVDPLYQALQELRKKCRGGKSYQILHYYVFLKTSGFIYLYLVILYEVPERLLNCMPTLKVWWKRMGLKLLVVFVNYLITENVWSGVSLPLPWSFILLPKKKKKNLPCRKWMFLTVTVTISTFF